MRKTTQAADTDLDALVARYAPVGRKVRRERRLRRSALALGLPLVAGVALVTWQWTTTTHTQTLPAAQTESAGDAAARIESALAEFRELKALVSAETGALGTQRAELARQRQSFEERGAKLLAQLDAVNTQSATLATQLRQFEEQRNRLDQTLARVDAERRALDSRQARGLQPQPGLDQQLAEIERQRRSLEDQQQQVRKQGELLAQEIARINTQRVELERQRETIEQQREEVKALLNQIREVGLNRLRDKQRSLPGRDDAEEAVAKAAETPAALATLAAVDDGTLSETRGGLDIGGDFSVSIGVTRTGTVNGIEQFSSALYVDDLMRVNGGGLPQIEAVMIQNGAGNLVTPDALGNIAPNVATIIQNTLDGQILQTQTVMDVSLQNVSQITQGISQSQAISQSLSLQR